jgi:hypothetical protein
MGSGRGGYREGSGRKSNWLSSSPTTPVRIPDNIVDKVLEYAHQLDKGESIEIAQNQTNKTREILDIWKSKVSGKELQPRWINVVKLISELGNSL